MSGFLAAGASCSLYGGPQLVLAEAMNHQELFQTLLWPTIFSSKTKEVPSLKVLALNPSPRQTF